MAARTHNAFVWEMDLDDIIDLKQSRVNQTSSPRPSDNKYWQQLAQAEFGLNSENPHNWKNIYFQALELTESNSDAPFRKLVPLRRHEELRVLLQEYKK